MAVADEVLHTLRTWRRMPAGDLRARLQVSRATLMRAVQALGPAVIVRGQARKTTYAARRALRGSSTPLPLYRVHDSGLADEVGLLHPVHPAGCMLDGAQALGWPLDGDMQDGWFDGLPYLLDDMRPQGFLGRNFARHHAALMQVPDDPGVWSEDDVLHTLSLLGADQPGQYILGEGAFRLWRAQAVQVPVAAAAVDTAYPALAAQAMAQGLVGSSAGGEFPKFSTLRDLPGGPGQVLVKFSGADQSPGTQRWSDLLVCEHLALGVVARQLQLAAAASCIHQAGGRTFLEVQRFDRHGSQGRSPVCTWAALNAGLFGLAGKPWTAAAAALRAGGLIDAQTQAAMQRLWHFGQLIANTDMHDGNLAFRPGLQLAPVYDMLPMLYAPQRGVELPSRRFAPLLPLPGELEAWSAAAGAAVRFWQLAGTDARISAGFRQMAAEHAQVVSDMQRQLGLG
ncbi:MAG: type II toxin-antitoxin system HipA family toxin YjjJ [Pseudomonadota bacterium]